MLDFTLLGFIETKTLLTIIHLLGVVIGMGAAMMTDVMYFTVVKDKIITKSELRFLNIGSQMVWLGLLIIVVSGLIMFLFDPAGYLESAKFLAKITIIGILFINGLIFHFEHLPTCRANLGRYLPDESEWRAKSVVLYASGAVSAASWLSVLVLGSLEDIPYDYVVIMLVYLLLLTVNLMIAMIARANFLNTTSRGDRK